MTTINELILGEIELKLDKVKDEMDSLSVWDKDWLDLAENEFIPLSKYRLKLLKGIKEIKEVE